MEAYVKSSTERSQPNDVLQGLMRTKTIQTQQQ